jgi:hypothetical protein
MSKHTPGPWTANEEFDDGESLGIAITGRLGQVVRVFDVGQEGFANAALIAAAPDLLSVLREAFRAFSHDDDGPVWADSTIAKARAAIAKATGEAA